MKDYRARLEACCWFIQGRGLRTKKLSRSGQNPDVCVCMLVKMNSYILFVLIWMMTLSGPGLWFLYYNAFKMELFWSKYVGVCVCWSRWMVIFHSSSFEWLCLVPGSGLYDALIKGDIFFSQCIFFSSSNVRFTVLACCPLMQHCDWSIVSNILPAMGAGHGWNYCLINQWRKTLW